MPRNTMCPCAFMQFAGWVDRHRKTAPAETIRPASPTGPVRRFSRSDWQKAASRATFVGNATKVARPNHLIKGSCPPHMRVSIALLIIWSALAAAPAHAADVAFNAYWGIPFDGGRAFFGANCELDPLAASAYQAEDE